MDLFKNENSPCIRKMRLKTLAPEGETWQILAYYPESPTASKWLHNKFYFLTKQRPHKNRTGKLGGAPASSREFISLQNKKTKVESRQRYIILTKYSN